MGAQAVVLLRLDLDTEDDLQRLDQAHDRARVLLVKAQVPRDAHTQHDRGRQAVLSGERRHRHRHRGRTGEILVQNTGDSRQLLVVSGQRVRVRAGVRHLILKGLNEDRVVYVELLHVLEEAGHEPPQAQARGGAGHHEQAQAALRDGDHVVEHLGPHQNRGFGVVAVLQLRGDGSIVVEVVHVEAGALIARVERAVNHVEGVLTVARGFLRGVEADQHDGRVVVLLGGLAQAQLAEQSLLRGLFCGGGLGESVKESGGREVRLAHRCP